MPAKTFDNTRARAEGWEIRAEKVRKETIYSLAALDGRYAITNPMTGQQLQSADVGLRRMIHHAAEREGSQYHKDALAFMFKNAPELYEAVMFGRDI